MNMIRQVGRVYSSLVMMPNYTAGAYEELPCLDAYMELMSTAIRSSKASAETEAQQTDEPGEVEIDWCVTTSRSLGEIAPLHQCVSNARPKGRWVVLEAPNISCRGKDNCPCGYPSSCIYCAAKRNAQGFSYWSGKRMAVAAGLSTRRAKWSSGASLGYLILSLMEVATGLGYDKSLSH